RNPAKRQIREQLWSIWLRDLPNHPSIERGEYKTTEAKGATADAKGDRNGARFVLKVQRPALTISPAPPPEIAEWLEAGWDDPSNDVATQ
ncbi:MAG TPA: hypothetical protein VH114_04425, partial [Candidatus Acidoferrum sp.]|nr:hypothetical protein [Candidatus Acidoferrum sp.]